MAEPAGHRPAAATLDAEEAARANWYGLIGRLFYAPPDPNLLSEISLGAQGGEETQGSGRLLAAWRGVQEACRSAYPAVVRQEYDALFVGVGKSQVTPYLSGYAEATAPDRYLVRLREQLDIWGLARREEVGEVEDHISGISDIMRWLIQNQHSLAEQREFFENFAYRGAIAFCGGVQKAASSNFYKPVAVLTSSYFDIERAAFEMGETA